MAIYLEMPRLDKEFPFRILVNDGNILTTPHWHRELELIYVTKGTITLGINDQPYTLSEGGIVFINSGDIHYVLASPGSERLVYQFDFSFFSSVSTEEADISHSFPDIFPLSIHWSEEDQKKVREILENVYLENRERHPGYQYVIKSAIFQLAVLFIRKLPKRENRKVQEINGIKNNEILEKLDQVFRYVENRYQQHISLQDAASEVGYSPFYFTRFFKKNTGKTFITFLNDYRIDKAKWLLINSDKNVSQIISEVGFESDKTFYRLFKNSLMLSPLEYRKKMSIN
ncbi:helix-turn-helix domain-containing protein [Enterococcus sp. BWM-S5]|uniref:Helix-turn-helix domain-containing protein n=1 Tax=Enterococcus larvae TaxID=2794352 RepID=A0ABS4CE18_9ENTE|nr:AraC family transcriptional regulator [Enterococcus larvae]MBP1044819.1 helix-turn-helix domain-containing protein [Enterococcus larvae]